MSPRFAFLALLTLTLAACDGANLPGMGTDTAVEDGHKGPPGVSPLEQPIETGEGAAPVATVDPETYNTAAFSARGNEPFWSVDVAGNTALYKTPDNQRGRAVRVNRITFAEGVEYVGVLGGSAFALTVRGTDCRDDMSGQKFPMTATLKVGSRVNNGCAAPATAEVANAVAAIKAPAPAAPKPRSTPKPATATPVASTAPAAAAASTPAATDDSSTETETTTSETSAATPTPTIPAPEMSLPSTAPTVTETTTDSGDTPAASE